MKNKLHPLINHALRQIEGGIEFLNDKIPYQIDATKDPSHGDYATNVAMLLAPRLKQPPRIVAEAIKKALPDNEVVERIDIAGPGFINFFLHPKAYQAVLADILLHEKDQFGHSDVGHGQKIHLEFVSANPTGPLHVGHGRSAAYGASVANLLKAVGYNVHREYYVNDAGRQMNILATSVWLRYLERCGESFTFPSNGYRGQYVYDIADQLMKNHARAFFQPIGDVLVGIPADEPEGDKEAHIDALIMRCKELLGNENYHHVFTTGLNLILDGIRLDLETFGVVYEEWFSETKLFPDGVNEVVQRLQKAGFLYEKEGATWFKSSQFGDEKDRVLIRENGQPTYFAGDIAHYLVTFEKNYDKQITILGSDHHGYEPRLRAALTACGIDTNKFDVRFVQFAILYRNKERLQMSTRSGEFVTLADLITEVGKDAARFFYVSRKNEQHMDFDLELAKSQSADNPVYYIQYAHARVCSVLRQLKEKGFNHDIKDGQDKFELLTESYEKHLLKRLGLFPDVISSAAGNYEPHSIAHYLRDLANDFHSYYNACPFLVADEHLRNARLNLIIATRQVIKNGLGLLGVSAPETM